MIIILWSEVNQESKNYSSVQIFLVQRWDFRVLTSVFFKIRCHIFGDWIDNSTINFYLSKFDLPLAWFNAWNSIFKFSGSRMILKLGHILVKRKKIRSHMNWFRSTCTKKRRTNHNFRCKQWNLHRLEIRAKNVPATQDNLYWRLNNVQDLFCFADNGPSRTKWIKDNWSVISNQLTSICTSLQCSKIIILSNKQSHFSSYCREFSATYR